MKIQVLLVSTVLVFAATLGNAKSTRVLQCSNGEEITVKIVETAQDVYRADVTVQSTGDSYPTYHFKNVTTAYAKRPGAPMIYHGGDFLMSVHAEVHIRASLTIPSLGIKNEALACK